MQSLGVGDRHDLRSFVCFALLLGFLFLLVFFLLTLSVSDNIAVVQIERHERAVLFQNAAKLLCVEDLLGFFGKSDRDGRTTVGLIRIGDLIIHTVFGYPGNCRSVLNERLGIDPYFIGDHERGIETETEVADDSACVSALPRIFLNEVHRAGKSDLVDVLIDFLFGHSDSVIGKLDRTLFAVIIDVQLILGIVFLDRFTEINETLELGDRVGAVTYELTDKDVLIRVKPLSDDRKYIFRCY